MSDTNDDIQVQQQIEQYHHIAQALRSSTEPTEIEALLEPINSLAETSQVAFLKALGKEKNTDAADIALALNTTSSIKDVRKEARRTLIRLESAHTYPEWSPIAKPTLSQVIEMNPEVTEMNSNDSVLSELQSIMSNITGMFSGPAYLDTVSAFIEAWSEERYEEAYDYLSISSPLRDGLTREDWAEQRRQWSKQAHPTDQQVAFINEISDQEKPDQQPRVEVGWSLTFAESPLAHSLKELPLATATFQETGRRWFWSSYTLVEEGEDWLVDTMTDEGANAMQLTVTELQTRLNEIVEIAAQRLAEEEDLLDDLDNEDDEDDDEDDDDDLDDDEDDDEDDEDDDEDEDEAFEDMLQRMDEAVRITTYGMHYNDALIAQIGKSDSGIYEQAYAQAMAVNEPERAVVYLQQLADTFPEKRAIALQELALTLNSIIDSYVDAENEEQVQRFRILEEKILREAIATDNAPSAYIMLADLLIDEEDRLDEAETLLNKAQTLPLNPQEVPLVEAGLAEIAQIRDEPETALQHYQKVADLAPDYPDIWFNLGSLHHQLHHHDEAILHLRRSVETAPSQTGAFAELAAIYIEQQQLGPAREILKQGLSTNPESADLLAVLSLTYIQSSDLHNAEKYLLQAEELDEDDELVHAIRAVYNEQKAQQRQAPKSKFKQQKQRKKKR